MACRACEERRVMMRIMAEASAEWTRNPTGPSIREVYLRLRAEAVERGELDAI
jgi:hypothetical protein